MESRKRIKLSDNQAASLERFYSQGMVGTGLNCREMVDRAVAETCLTTAQVKKWIGNRKRKRPVYIEVDSTPDEDSQLLKRATSIRGPNPYDVFCSDFLKSEQCIDLECEENNKLASEVWKGIEEDEKRKFKSSADAIKNVNIQSLSDEQKGKFISQHKKKLMQEILKLEELGCVVTTILRDNVGKIFELGSQSGNMFLASHPDVVVKFRDCFLNDSHEYCVHHVQNLFNQKYSIAVGKPSRVPYLKGGFVVEGLPDGVPFKKPYHYGALQCKKIMTAAKDVKFILTSQTETCRAETSVHNPKETSSKEEICRLLSCIAGTQVAEDAIGRAEKKIKKEDVKVQNFVLTEAERALLYSSCEDFFQEDAWLAVGRNIKHCCEVKNMILPIYTEANERFWLFHTIAKPSFIQTCGPVTKLKGYWMDLKPSGEYSMLSEQICLFGKNIVHTLHGPLYFIADDNLLQAKVYKPSIDCRKAIINALELLR
ncbi:uncharacterized protein LOC114540925 [Dendronephthya gigantea]|uniref:uncharacterized protein LOC114540925 n=1 Tax=Dendronephthya gigantea TaxID=151771 RepID=UPI00106CAF46|nr:uncharacterized protein LOC114540925 [Dendronephthya gigantea]